MTGAKAIAQSYNTIVKNLISFSLGIIFCASAMAGQASSIEVEHLNGDPCVLPKGLSFQKQARHWDTDMIFKTPHWQEPIWWQAENKLAVAAAVNGAEVISWFDIEKFRTEMISTRICSNTSSRAIIGSGDRKGAVNFTEENLVIFDTDFVNDSLPNNPGAMVFFLHEFLGANGYPDENYQISSVLLIKANPAPFVGAGGLPRLEAALTRYLNHAQRHSANLHFADAGDGDGSGGGSGVGGGGDPFIADIKLNLIAYTFFNHASDPHFDRILDQILSAPLEPLDVEQALQNREPVTFDANIELAIKEGQKVIAIKTKLMSQFLANSNAHTDEIRNFFSVLYRTVVALNPHPTH